MAGWNVGIGRGTRWGRFAAWAAAWTVLVGAAASAPPIVRKPVQPQPAKPRPGKPQQGKQGLPAKGLPQGAAPFPALPWPFPPAQPPPPPPPRTLCVAAVAPLDELWKDCDYVVRLAGSPGLPPLEKLFRDYREVLAAVDHARPGGGVVRITEDWKIVWLAFVPVVSRNAFLRLVENWGLEVPEAEGGGGRVGPAYYKVVDGYALIASEPSALKAPPDPVRLLQPLLKYDLGVAIAVQEIPRYVRQTVVSSSQYWLETNNGWRMGIVDSEDERVLEIAKLFARQVGAALDDTRRLDLGVAIQREHGKLFAECVLSPLAGTESSKGLAALGAYRTRFSALRDPGAVWSMHLSTLQSNADQKALQKVLFGVLGAKLRSVVETAREERAAGAEWQALEDDALQVGMDLGGDMLEKGRFDAAAAVWLKQDGTPLVLAAAHLPGARRMEKLLLRLAEVGGRSEAKLGLKLKVAHYKGVDFHQQLPEGAAEDPAGAFFGVDAERIIGFSDDAVWSGAGVAALDEIKAAIDLSERPHELPGGAGVDLAPVAFFSFPAGVKLAAGLLGGPGGEVDPARRAAIFAAASGSDRIRLRFNVSEWNDAVFRWEVDEGVVKLLGAVLNPQPAP